MFSLNIFVEGFLNSRPQVSLQSLLDLLFPDPPCHQNFFVIIIVVVDVPSLIFNEFDKVKVRKPDSGLGKGLRSSR